MGADGQQIGVVDTREAIRQARELDLDLVEVAPQANPPVCRIMDYGKFKYERDIRQKEARKKQSRTRPEGDQVPAQDRPARLRHEEGPRRAVPQGRNKVKVTIMFRGREMAHTELGRKILDRLVGDLGEKVVVESMPKQEGRNMIMVVSPSKKFMEQLAKDRERDGAEPEAPEPDDRGPGRARVDRHDGGRGGADRARRGHGHRGGGSPSRSPPPRTKDRAMPKMKSHSATTKRFRVTRKGKVLHRKATGNHMLTKKSGGQRRRVEGMSEVTAENEEDQATAGEGLSHGAGQAIRPRQEEAPRGPREGQGLHGEPPQALPRRQGAGHALRRVRLPRPSRPQGAVPAAVDRPHQRGDAARTASRTRASSTG